MKNGFLLVVFGAMAFTACIEKNFSDTPAMNTEQFQDLSVAADFSWDMSQAIACVVESPNLTRVSVSDQVSGEPFAKFLAGGGAAPMNLPVPSNVQTLYFTYEDAAGQSITRGVGIVNQSASLRAQSTRPFDDMTSGLYEGALHIPSYADGWATILFEDQWPSYGDYDFNDAVYNYKIQLELDRKNQTQLMRVYLRVKALSGSFPYLFHLQLAGLRSSDVGEINLISSSNTKDAAAPAMVLIPPIDPTKDRPVFRFDGLKNNKNQIKGATWLNTEVGCELAEELLVTACFEVHFTRAVDLGAVNFSGPDFFLARTDKGVFGPEIHRCNIEPLNEAVYYQIDFANLTTRYFYKSKDHLIWALNVPADVAHPYEKSDFLKAYPEFATWAQSSGQQAKEWYKRGVRQHLVQR